MTKVYAYVDGFNLYHRALKKNPALKWLDLQTLIFRFVRETDLLAHINYYTSRVSGRTDPKQPERQNRYLRALSGKGNLTVHIGKFISKPVCRPLVDAISLVHPACTGHQYLMVHNTDEKGCDVKLASHLIRDGFLNAYDVAVVVSADTDLVEPMKIVKNELRKTVILLYTDLKRKSVPNDLKNAASLVRFITASDLRASQFPDCTLTTSGEYVRRPEPWT